MIFFFEKIRQFLTLTLKVQFRHFLTDCLKQFPLSMLILGQKSCILGPTIFKIPQPN